MKKESENKEVCQKGNELGRDSFLCIQCLTPSKTLYKVSGTSVKLTRCSRCEGEFMDQLHKCPIFRYISSTLLLKLLSTLTLNESCFWWQWI